MSRFPSLFRQSRKEAHVTADVEAGVFDQETFVRAFSNRKFTSSYELRKHRSTLTKKAEQNELDGDLRAAHRASSHVQFASIRAAVGMTLFAGLEVMTLADVLMALGTPPKEAYPTSIITAVVTVGLIEGATRARQRYIQILCYLGLTILMLGIAWARSASFFAAESSIESVVGGVIAMAAAAGAGVALHHYRQKARAAAADQQKVSLLRRDKREIDRRVAAAEKAIIRNEVETEARDSEEATLRGEYARLHQIATARRSEAGGAAAVTH